MSSLVAQKYGYALFEVGKEQDVIDSFMKEVSSLHEVFYDNEDLSCILANPEILKSEKREIIDKIFKENHSQELMNLLYLLVDKRRIDYILEIFQEFERLYYEYKNVKKAVVTTVFPLSEEKLSKLKETLEKDTNSSVLLENVVDKSIIGGAIVDIDGKRIDGSIESELKRIKFSLG